MWQFRARKATAKSRTLQSGFIHTFLIWTEFLFIQEVSGVFTSPFLDTDQLKMALRARKVFGAFEKRVPAPSELRDVETIDLSGQKVMVNKFGGLAIVKKYNSASRTPGVGSLDQRCIILYYMALSHKDWELPNSRIWLAEMDTDSGLDFPI